LRSAHTPDGASFSGDNGDLSVARKFRRKRSQDARWIAFVLAMYEDEAAPLPQSRLRHDSLPCAGELRRDCRYLVVAAMSLLQYDGWATSNFLGVGK
jgi:hypothetical protein